MSKLTLGTVTLGLLSLIFLFPAEAKVFDVKQKGYPAFTSLERYTQISEQEKDRILQERADYVCREESGYDWWVAKTWGLTKTKTSTTLNGELQKLARKNLFAAKSHEIFSWVDCYSQPTPMLVGTLRNFFDHQKSTLAMQPESSACREDLTKLNIPPQKASKGLLKEQVYLSNYPNQINSYGENEELTIGDLHGNTLKLLYFLIHEGILELGTTPQESQALYDELKTIYRREGILSIGQPDSEGIKRFGEILNRAKIKENGPKLRFLGDEMADRGLNDYFTLQVISKLHQSKVPFEIILSNHGVEFIQYYENEDYRSFMGDSFSRSLTGLQRLRRLKKTDFAFQKSLKESIQQNYLPHIKVLSYSMNPGNQLSFYTHAPVGLEAVEKLVTLLNLQSSCSDYNGRSKNLMKCIDEINKKFDEIKNSSTVSNFIAREREFKDVMNHAFHYVTGNRDRFRNVLDRRKKLDDGVQTLFVHGHDGGKSISHENVTGLDNQLGMGIIEDIGEYSIFHSIEANQPADQVAPAA